MSFEIKIATLLFCLNNNYIGLLLKSKLEFFSISEGNLLHAMAEAIEQSAAVVVCMSQKYKESLNCRSGKQRLICYDTNSKMKITVGLYWLTLTLYLLYFGIITINLMIQGVPHGSMRSTFITLFNSYCRHSVNAILLVL